MTPLYIAEEYPNVFETENNDASCCDSRLYEHGLYARADVKIGVAGPFTGPNATYGAQYWKGPRRRWPISRRRRHQRRKDCAGAGDDACEPKQAVAVANRLVDEAKVSAVVGHFCSSSTMPASEVYDEAGILTITPGSTNPQITERGMKDIFRMCGRDDQQGRSPPTICWTC